MVDLKSAKNTKTDTGNPNTSAPPAAARTNNGSGKKPDDTRLGQGLRSVGRAIIKGIGSTIDGLLRQFPTALLCLIVSFGNTTSRPVSDLVPVHRLPYYYYDCTTDSICT